METFSPVISLRIGRLVDGTRRGFAGSLEGRRAHKGVLITTSEFSPEVRDYVHTIGKKIVLIGGQRLAELMIEHGIGVTDGPAYQRQIVDQSLRPRRAYTWLFGGFAAIALVMAIAGVYGVMSYSVVQRTREIGIRMALGAQRRQVLRQVLFAAATLASAGAAFGLAGAWFASRLMQSLLAGVSGHDPQPYLIVVALLGIAILAAALIPARRAASVDPLRALKYE